MFAADGGRALQPLVTRVYLLEGQFEIALVASVIHTTSYGHNDDDADVVVVLSKQQTHIQSR